MSRSAILLAACVAAFVAVDAFVPKSGLPLATRSAPRARAAPPSMEVWSEKNIRFSLLAGVGLPIVGVVTPPDNALAATILPLAIAGIWIYIFVDLLKAATPEDA